MTKRIAINGLGRIGRIILKELISDDTIDIVAVNDLCNVEDMCYLLKYDSVHGKSDLNIKSEGSNLIVNDKKIIYLSESSIEKLPWEKLNIDLVVECTGLYTKLESAEKHILSGARHVIISAPGKGKMKTIVFGVNEKTLTGKEKVISAASCTTNCLAPILKLVNDKYHILNGYMSTIHAYTNDQVNLDKPHKKGFLSRRGRACGLNCIPTTTGAAEAIGKVIPELDGLIKGSAYRVPLSDGSMVDIYLNIKKKITINDLNELFIKNSNDTLNYTNDPIVSSDIVGMKCGALVDGLLTDVLNVGKQKTIKITAWYDNEYGYSCQMIRTIKYFLNIEK